MHKREHEGCSEWSDMSDSACNVRNAAYGAVPVNREMERHERAVSVFRNTWYSASNVLFMLRICKS